MFKEYSKWTIQCYHEPWRKNVNTDSKNTLWTNWQLCRRMVVVPPQLWSSVVAEQRCDREVGEALLGVEEVVGVPLLRSGLGEEWEVVQGRRLRMLRPLLIAGLLLPLIGRVILCSRRAERLSSVQQILAPQVLFPENIRVICYRNKNMHTQFC